MIKSQYLTSIGSTQDELKRQLRGEQPDFKELKARCSITDLLDTFGVLDDVEESPTTDGELIGTCCPACNPDRKSFVVSVEKNTFRCMSCKVRGSVIDLVCAFNGGRGECNIREAGTFLTLWLVHRKEATQPLDKSLTKQIEASGNVTRFPRELTTGAKGELHRWLTEARDDLDEALGLRDLNRARLHIEAVLDGINKILADTRLPQGRTK